MSSDGGAIAGRSDSRTRRALEEICCVAMAMGQVNGGVRLVKVGNGKNIIQVVSGEKRFFPNFNVDLSRSTVLQA